MCPHSAVRSWELSSGLLLGRLPLASRLARFSATWREQRALALGALEPRGCCRGGRICSCEGSYGSQVSNLQEGAQRHPRQFAPAFAEPSRPRCVLPTGAVAFSSKTEATFQTGDAM